MEKTEPTSGRSHSVIKYRTIEDLVKFVSMTPQPFLNHIEVRGRHVYFFYVPFSGGIVVCFAEATKGSVGSYVVMNRISGQISYSDRPKLDPQSSDIPILEVGATDLSPLFDIDGGRGDT